MPGPAADEDYAFHRVVVVRVLVTTPSDGVACTVACERVVGRGTDGDDSCYQWNTH